MDDDIRRFELMRNMFVADNEIRLKMLLKGYTNEEIDGFFRGEKLPSKAPAPQVPPPASTVSPPQTPSQPPKPRIKSENRSVPLLANNGLDRYRYLLMRDMNVPDSKIREKMMINGMSKEDIDKFFEEYPNPNPEPENEMHSSGSKSMRSTPRGNSPAKRPFSEAVDPFQLDLSGFVKTLRNNVADDVIRTKMESAGFSPAEIEALLADSTSIGGTDLRASPMIRSHNSATSNSRPVSARINMNVASPGKATTTAVPKQITMSVGNVDLKAAPGFFRVKSVRLQEGINGTNDDDQKQRQSLKATMTSDYSDNSDINNNPASSKDMENRKSAHLNNLTQFSGKSTISSSFRVASSRSINMNNSTHSSGNNNGNGNNNNKGSFDKLTSSTASASGRLPGTNEEQFDRDSGNSNNNNNNNGGRNSNNSNSSYDRFRASDMTPNEHRSSFFSSLRWMLGLPNNNNNAHGKPSFSSIINNATIRASPGPKDRGVRRSKSLHALSGKESRFASLFKRKQQQQRNNNVTSSGKVIRL